MSDTATTGETGASTASTTETGAADTGAQENTVEFWQAEAEKHKSLSRKHEERAKANANAAKELEQFRQQTMTETEKAIEQARNEGRQLALTEVGAKVAAAEFRAAAAGRLDPEQVDTLLENLNVGRFIGEDGEVDREAVARFVDGIAPKPTEESSTATALDLGQGTRTNQNAALNGDPLLRDLKSKLGIA